MSTELLMAHGTTVRHQVCCHATANSGARHTSACNEQKFVDWQKRSPVGCPSARTTGNKIVQASNKSQGSEAPVGGNSRQIPMARRRTTANTAAPMQGSRSFEPEATCQCVDYIHLVLEPSTTNRLIDRSTNRPTHQPTKKSIPASRAIKSLAQIRLNPFLLKVAPPLSNHFHAGDLRVASHALTFVDQLFLGVHPVGFKAHRCARTSLDVTHGAGGAARRAELGISERRPARRKHHSNTNTCIQLPVPPVSNIC